MASSPLASNFHSLLVCAVILSTGHSLAADHQAPATQVTEARTIPRHRPHPARQRLRARKARPRFPARSKSRRSWSEIIIPKLELPGASVREAIEFLRKRSVALDTGYSGRPKGHSVLGQTRWICSSGYR